MRSSELTLGRTFAVAFDHGEDFFTALTTFCQENGVRQGYVPAFIAGFSDVQIVGTCERLDDPNAPVWTKVHLTNAEAFGGGTLAYDAANDRVAPHIHVAVGLKEHSATGHTSHLLGATVQFLTEMLVIEVTAPAMRRVPSQTSTTCPSCSSVRAPVPDGRWSDGGRVAGVSLLEATGQTSCSMRSKMSASLCTQVQTVDAPSTPHRRRTHALDK